MAPSSVTVCASLGDQRPQLQAEGMFQYSTSLGYEMFACEISAAVWISSGDWDLLSVFIALHGLCPPIQCRLAHSCHLSLVQQ